MKTNRSKIISWALCVLLICFIAAELIARFFLGLGDPPLFKLDPEIEYLALPDGDYERFGNQISYNSYSMRASQFPETKTDPNELRIMVIGDSVINGGSRIDQVGLATEVLKQRLQKRLGRPVVVGNISAGSWGPANQLAYIERFGIFDADLVTLVTHSQDLTDEPAFDSVLGVAQPMTDRAPTLASYELVVRYGPRLLAPFTSTPETSSTMREDGSDLEFTTKDVMDEMAAFILNNGASFGILYHLTRSELPLRPTPAENALRAYSAEHDIGIRVTTDHYNQSRLAGRMLYQDDIHLNAVGQIALADELEALTLAWLRTQSQDPAAEGGDGSSPSTD